MKVTIRPTGTSRLPSRAYDNDAGADVALPHGATVKASGVTRIPLGFSLEVPDGYAAFIFPRSSWTEMGLICQLPPIDSGYRGEVHAIVLNATSKDIYVAQGERLGQLVIMPIVVAEFVEHKRLRGGNAFGSSGR